MSDKKISQLTDAGALQNTDYTVIVREGQNYKMNLYNNIPTGSTGGSEYLSAGIYTTPTYTISGTSIYVSGCDVVLFSNADGSGLLNKYSVAPITSTTLSLWTENLSVYIVADYNNGSPILREETDVTLINETTIIPILTCTILAGYVHVLEWDNLSKALSNKLHQRLVKTDRTARESGLALSCSGLQPSMTGGVAWLGANAITISAADYNDMKMIYHNYNTDNWTISATTTLNNTYYNQGDGLWTLDNNKYAVNYIFAGLESEGEFYVLMGYGDYTLKEAQEAPVPLLPDLIAKTCILVGRVIYKKGETTYTQLESTFDTQFNYGGATSHKDLSDLQGGNSTEYYHLTNNDYTRIINAPDLTKEYTGFYVNESDDFNKSIGISYNSTNRTVTLTGSFTVYWRGIQITALTNGWTSPAHNLGIREEEYLVYNGTDFVWVNHTNFKFWYLQIAQVVASSTGVHFCMRETHGFQQWQDHYADHQTTGTYRYSGCLNVAGSWTANNSTATNRRPDFAAGIIQDEDLQTTIALVSGGTSAYTMCYLSGSSAVFLTDQLDFVRLFSTNRPGYQSYVGGSWTQLGVNSSNYVSVWRALIPVTSDSGSQKYRNIFLQGQWQSTTAAIERTFTPAALNTSILGDLFNECIFVEQIIIYFTGAGWQIVEINEIKGSRGSQFTVSGVNNFAHNLSIGLQGGTTDEYYHLTSNDYTKVIKNTTEITLTDGATVGWTFTSGSTAKIILGGNRNLSISGATNGDYGVLKVVQDATGSRTLTLPSGSKFYNGRTTIALTSTPNAVDMLSFYYDGTNFFWTAIYNFT